MGAEGVVAVTRLVDVIVEKPLDETPGDPVRCPHCGAGEPRLEDHMQTLVGSLSGGDPNHHWYHFTCAACGRTFCREVKSGNVWYTQYPPPPTHEGAPDGGAPRVLKGVSNCTETYLYTCAIGGCGALAQHVAYDAGGNRTETITWRREGGRWVRLGYDRVECDNGHATRIEES